MKITLAVEQIVMPEGGLPIAYADKTGRAVFAQTLDDGVCYFAADANAMADAIAAAAAAGDTEISIAFNITNRN